MVEIFLAPMAVPTRLALGAIAFLVTLALTVLGVRDMVRAMNERSLTSSHAQNAVSGFLSRDLVYKLPE